MTFSTLLLDFSGIYLEEGFHPAGADRIDFSGVEGTGCYCAPSAAAKIRHRLKDCPYEALHWIDSGDYHYLTLFWLEKISCPFDLILIDHHPDDQPSALGGGLLSCGGWVADARRSLPLMGDALWISNYASFSVLRPGRPVYLSIDKDVLSPEFARTDWDQGDMTLGQLKDCLQAVAASREILGIDVCGGLSLSKGACGKDVEINRRTDEELQAFLVSLRTI